MATYSAAVASSVNTTALMRAFAHFIVDQLSAWGWVKTADTGQTATDSLPAEANTNTVGGYQIWRMGDALQATSPVFLKIEFGSSSSSSAPAVWLTLGTGTDGAGNLTGQVSTRSVLGNTSSTTTTSTCYASGASNRCAFAMFMSNQNTAYSLFFSIERSKNASGEDTGDGVILFGAAANGTVKTQYLPASGAIRAVQSYPAIPVFQGITSLANGGDVGMIPLFPQNLLGAVNPGNTVWFYYQPDLVALNPVVATLKGATHTVLPLGVITTAYSNWASHSYAMLYE